LKAGSKTPAVTGWSRPDYEGVEPTGRVALRADGLVIIDCDSDEAAARWRQIGSPTLEVKTPRGWHFYYTWTPGSPTGPAVDVFGSKSGIDVRAGIGSYVVAPPTEGYKTVKKRKPAPFTPAWLPKQHDSDAGSDLETWTSIPVGRRDDTLTALAGSLRRQGMAPELIYQTLLAWNETIVEQPAGDEMTARDIERIVRSVVRYAPQPDWSIEIEGEEQPLSELALADILDLMSNMTLPPPAEWYWRPYLPKGRLVLLDGAEGIGKGLFCSYIVTLLAKDGTPALWASTEDDPEEDIQKRLLAAGYVRGKYAEVGFFKVDPKFPNDIAVLEKIINDFGAGIVVLDPGRSFLAPPEGVKSSFNDEAAIRPGLESLNRLAKRTGCTIVFVHHWNKNTQTTVQYRSAGSGAFAQVVRHRITLVWHGPTDGGSGVFEVSKSNIGPRGHVHSYELDPVAHYDTARFVLGEELPEYPDAGAWMKAMEKEDAGLELDMQDEITDHIRALPGGAPVPAVSELQETWGIKRRQAQDLVASWLRDGVVRRGAQKRLYRVGEHERAD
jgi:KaiC/GvpD/RAD55 family RecA-like ATPase